MKTLSDRHYPPFWPPLCHAFSLVEVMLALAIAALGFITMLGMLPHGLQLARTSAEISTEARIKQKLSGELLTASWDQLNWTGFGPTRYFNDQGIELSQAELDGGVDGNLGLTYLASVQLPAEPLDFRLPAGGQSQNTETFLRRAKICIATSPDPDFDFDSAPARRLRSYTAILANTGKHVVGIAQN